ncbi:MAG: protein kinase [Chloroflexi bacterium]|nr:protein kinase [Chloroflexota bacterium]
MTLEQGTLLNGRYRIVEILGQGGMGSVYRALDENLSVEVAVKENSFTTDEYSRQFRLEAVILASVRHQHLPRVTDHFVMEDQGQYLVMDYIEGEDLRQRMERLGNISDEDAILIGAAVCEALAYLHTRKPPVLHRDIKPGNIKITSNGEIYLVDFGLAKLVQGSQTTTTGARAMTPGYSPPEQYGTARTDPRSDVYSLGATLYAALTGIIPEDGLARVMDNTLLTPVRKHNPKISRRLATSIEKAMEAYPDDRYQNATEFRQALLFSSSKTLRFVEDDLNISVNPPPKDETQPPENGNAEKSGNFIASQPKSFSDEIAFAAMRFRRRIRRFASLGVWIVFALVLGTGWLLWANNPGFRAGVMSMLPQTAAETYLPPPTAKPTEPLITPFPASTETVAPPPTATNTALPPSPTPLGGGLGEIAFASTRTGIPQIYIMRANGDEAQQVTNERDGACQPDWSPDGEKIVYITPCRKKQDTYQGSSLFILDMNTRLRTALPASLGGDFEPAWSPDNKHIAFTSLRDGYMEIYMIDLTNNQFTRLTKAQNMVAGVYARQAAWNPFGSQIAYVIKRQGLSQIWVTTDGDANMSKPNDQLVQSGNVLLDSMPAWSPDGQFVVFNQTNFAGTALFKLLSMRYEDRATRQAVPVNIEPLPVVDVSFSPDGQWLAFESWPDKSGNQDIYVTTVSGANRARLTTDPGLDFDPVWRPSKKN